MRAVSKQEIAAAGTGNIEECREALAEAVERLQGITRRIERNGDFLSAWTIREVAERVGQCLPALDAGPLN